MLGAAAIFALAACDDDDTFADPVYPEDPAVTGATIAEGATVNPLATQEMTVWYNCPIQINKGERFYLNGEPVIPTVESNQGLHFFLDLKKNMDYKLEIPAQSVICNRGLSYGPAYTLNFKTNDGSIIIETDYQGLANANATAQAKKVYDFLAEQTGKKILSGAMANVSNNNDFADWVYAVTGKYPALTGYDFIHIDESWANYAITPARTQWENNGLVSYMWHWRAPNTQADYDAKNTSKYGFYISGDGATDFDIREALKEGTWQHDFVLESIDKIAVVLKQLQEAGIPVLWRPLHEAAGNYGDNGAWFWWGRYGLDATKDLWKLMYDRLVNHHGLNNLIWVWTMQYKVGAEADMAAAYPGDEYVDIVGVDLYPDNNASQVLAYKAALDLTSAHKIVTLSECGRIPNPEACAADGAAWAWFMVWYTHSISADAGTDAFDNTREYWTEVMEATNVLTREQMPSLK